MATYLCKYGHKHRTKKGVAYCHVNVPWREKEKLMQTTPWARDGTQEVWSDLGQYRDLFWSATRYHILMRDKTCQYEGCERVNDLEVHHIVPRRLGGTDHPANLISLCHAHHRIQPCHHHAAGLVLCDAELPANRGMSKYRKVVRPNCEANLSDFGF